LSQATMWHRDNQHTARQRAVWCTSLATGQQDESPTTRRLTRHNALRKSSEQIGMVWALVLIIYKDDSAN
jgi:hypothetical protein